jgi:ABC-type transport system involved in cytochrome c biogenesis permease component
MLMMRRATFSIVLVVPVVLVPGTSTVMFSRSVRATAASAGLPFCAFYSTVTRVSAVTTIIVVFAIVAVVKGRPTIV